MFSKIVVLRTSRDSKGEIVSATLGFFDKNGVLQLEVPQIDGNNFPKDIKNGKQIVFTHPAKVIDLK